MSRPAGRSLRTLGVETCSAVVSQRLEEWEKAEEERVRLQGQERGAALKVCFGQNFYLANIADGPGFFVAVFVSTGAIIANHTALDLCK